MLSSMCSSELNSSCLDMHPQKKVSWWKQNPILVAQSGFISTIIPVKRVSWVHFGQTVTRNVETCHINQHVVLFILKCLSKTMLVHIKMSNILFFLFPSIIYDKCGCVRDWVSTLKKIYAFIQEFIRGHFSNTLKYSWKSRKMKKWNHVFSRLIFRS